MFKLSLEELVSNILLHIFIRVHSVSLKEKEILISMRLPI